MLRVSPVQLKHIPRQSHHRHEDQVVVKLQPLPCSSMHSPRGKSDYHDDPADAVEDASLRLKDGPRHQRWRLELRLDSM
jgi:hypothetical protein